MPREMQKSIKGQTQVNPQETFDFTVPRRETHARPVSMDVEVGADPKKTAILNFIDKMSGVAKDVTQYTDKQNIERRKAGARSSARGEELEENPHWAFLEGYENLNGEVGAGDYRLQANDLVNKSEDMAPVEFTAAMDKLSQGFMNGRSDAFLDGFLPKARHAEEIAELSYQKIQHNKFIRENNAKLNSKFTDDIGILYSPISGLSPDESAKELHNALVREQQFAEKHKIGSKNDVTKVFADTVLNNAIRSTNSSLLDVFKVEDESGISLGNVGDYGNMVTRAEVAIDRAEVANDNAAQAANKAAIKLASESAQRAVSDAIVDRDRVKAKDTLATFRDILPPKVYDKFLNEIDKGSEVESFGKFTNADVQRRLFNKAVYGGLTAEDFRVNRLQLEKDEYIELGEVNARAMKSISSSGTKPKHMTLVDEYKKYLKPLAAGDSTFELWGGEEHKRIADAMYILNRRVSTQVTKDGAGSIDDTWLYKNIKEIADLVNGAKPKEQKEDKTDVHHIGLPQPSDETPQDEGLSNIGTRS